MSHESAKDGGFTFQHWFVVIRNCVMMRDAIGVDCSRICLLVGHDVHRRVEVTSEVPINRAVPACVMTEPVEYDLKVVLFRHALCMVNIGKIINALLGFNH